MPTLLGIAVIVSLLAGFVGLLVAITSESYAGHIFSFGISFIAAFVIMMVIVFPMQGATGFWFTFSHWTDAGYMVSALVVLITGSIGGLLVEGESKWSLKPVIFLTLAFFVYAIFMPPFFAGPSICNVEANQEVIKLLDMKDVEIGSLPEVPPTEFITVSEANSGRKAQRVVMPASESQLMTYMSVNTDGYEQAINGTVYNVHDLRVTGAWNDYVRYGNSETPGVVLVDVTGGETTSAQWIALPDDQHLRYVSGAGFWSGLDLEWYVYTHFTLPKNVVIAELGGIEIDDNMKPWYTASIIRPSSAGGGKMRYPTGVMVMDPVTGNIQEYSWEGTPDWIDRILPVETAKELVKWYGQFNPNHNLCNSTNSNIGQLAIDVKPVIYPVYGQTHAQFIMTTMNENDPAARELIEVNLRTGASSRYKLTGVVPSEIEDDIEKQLKGGVPTAEFNAVEPQLRVINGKPIWMFLVEFNDRAWGFAGIQPGLSMYQQSADVIIGRTLSDFASRLTAQDTESIAERRATVGTTSEQIQTQGILIRMSAPTLEDGEEKVSFTVVVTNTNGIAETHRFKVRAVDSTAKLMQPGDELTVIAKDDGQEFMEVVKIENHTYSFGLEIVE